MKLKMILLILALILGAVLMEDCKKGEILVGEKCEKCPINCLECSDKFLENIL